MIFSKLCNNPSKGFRNDNGSQVANAGQGYYVMDYNEAIEAFGKGHNHLENKIKEEQNASRSL